MEPNEILRIATNLAGKNRYDEQSFLKLISYVKQYAKQDPTNKKEWDEVIIKIQYMQKNSEESQADLSTFPSDEVRTPLVPGSKIVIGDIHGNWLKLIWILIAQGILELKQNEKDYARLRSLYIKSFTEFLTHSERAELNNILRNAKWNKASITLLGDETGDRGTDDSVTLDIFSQATENDIEVEILFSDHGAEFIHFYERGCPPNHQARLLGNGQAQSMENVGRMIAAGKMSSGELSDKIGLNYIPLVKLFSYTVDYNTKHISLFSHAPVGLYTIAGAAEKFEVIYKDEPLEELVKTIDAINEKFNWHLKNRNVTAMLESEERILELEGRQIVNASFAQPLVRATWTRYQNDSSVFNRAELCFEQDEGKSYKINSFHGHDRGGSLPGQIIASRAGAIKNLDDQLGKFYAPENDLAEEGIYRRYVNFEQGPPSLKPRLKAAEEQVAQERKERPIKERAKNEKIQKKIADNFMRTLRNALKYKVRSWPLSTSTQRMARTAEVQLLKKIQDNLISADKEDQLYFKLEAVERLLLAISNDLQSEFRYADSALGAPWDRHSALAKHVENLLEGIHYYKQITAALMPEQVNSKDRKETVEKIINGFQDSSATRKYHQLIEDARKEEVDDLYKRPGIRGRGE